MAVAYDNATGAYSAVNVSSHTFAHAVGAGLSNGVLLVAITYYGSTKSASSVTYNGVAMTLYRRYNNGVAAATCELWYLANPTSGSNNVVITMNAAMGAGSYIGGMAMSLSGADQTTPVETGKTEATVTGSHNSQSNALTPVADGTMVCAVLTCSSTTAPTATGSGQTARVSQVQATENHGSGFSTQGPISPAASTTASWSWTTSSAASVQLVVAVAPASSGVTATSSLALPLGGGPTGTVLVQGTSSKALPLAGAATGVVGVAADSSRALPLNGSATGVVLVGATAAAALPLGGAGTGTVLVSAASTRVLPIGGSATATGPVGTAISTIARVIRDAAPRALITNVTPAAVVRSRTPSAHVRQVNDA